MGLKSKLIWLMLPSSDNSPSLYLVDTSFLDSKSGSTNNSEWYSMQTRRQQQKQEDKAGC